MFTVTIVLFKKKKTKMHKKERLQNKISIVMNCPANHN